MQHLGIGRDAKAMMGKPVILGSASPLSTFGAASLRATALSTSPTTALTSPRPTFAPPTPTRPTTLRIMAARRPSSRDAQLPRR
jgi:hypothetical protein